MASHGKINKKVKRNCIHTKKLKGIKRRIGPRIIERNVVGKKKKIPTWILKYMRKQIVLILRTKIILHCSLTHPTNLDKGLSKLKEDLKQAKS